MRAVRFKAEHPGLICTETILQCSAALTGILLIPEKKRLVHRWASCHSLSPRFPEGQMSRCTAGVRASPSSPGLAARGERERVEELRAPLCHPIISYS